MTASLSDMHILSTTRLFPESHLDGSIPARVVPLSMLDAKVVGYAPSSAIWLYNRPADERGLAALSTSQLTLSLQKTLNAYPQWAGQLHWAPYNADGKQHTERFGRLCLSFGATSDPGVELVIAHCQCTLSSLVPSDAERAEGPGWWEAGQVPLAKHLLPTTPLPLYNMVDYAGLPGAIIQLTTFDCGGVSIAVKFAHTLADAQSMMRFVHDWEEVNRALLDHAPLPTLSPVFDPLLVDRAAAGDIDALKPDPTLVDIARSLPMHRFDCWASAEGCPPFLAETTKTPSVLDLAAIQPLGTPLPWSEWNYMAPVSHYLVYFSADEIRRMWEEASSSLGPSSTSRISRLDALLAHVWALIIRARGLEHDEPVHLNVTLGFRTRLCPPLPDTFLGSPLTPIRVTSTGGFLASAESSLGTTAASIRSTIEQFNSATIPALLHDIAYEVGGQRLWHAFMGRRNTIVTSWLRHGVVKVDFGGGERPRYVESIMPEVDGCVQVMESGHHDEDGGTTGMSVSLHLATDVMQKLLNDPQLRKYRRS